MNQTIELPFPVLVVDDDASIRATYRHILQPPPSELGGLEALISGDDSVQSAALFQVFEAEQGELAAQLQQQRLEKGLRFPLAFIDMRMPPGWDGLRTAVSLRKQDPSIYIVIATAFSDYDVNELQRQLGHDVVLLRKPFNQEEVLQLARTLCQSWQTRQRLEAVTAEMEVRVRRRTAELERRNTLQAVLIEIANRFIEVGPEDAIDDAVNWSLARLGRVIDVDACALFRFDAAQDAYQCSYSWHALGVRALTDSMRSIERGMMAPVHARFLHGESFDLAAEDLRLPEMAQLRELVADHYQRCLAVPLEVGGRLLGYFSVSMVQAGAAWDAGLDAVLRSAGHTITRALEAFDINQKLRASQALLHTTQRTAHIGNWSLDAETRRMWWDAELLRISGIDAERQQPDLKLLESLVLAPDWPRLSAAIALVLETGQSSHTEFRIRRPDGIERWINGWAEPQRAEDGRIVRLIGMVQDVTEQAEAAAALSRSEMRFRSIVETAEEGIWQVGPDWRTAYVNRRMEEMLGCAPGEMLGHTITDFIDADAVAQVGKLQLQREAGLRETHDFIFRRRDGGVLYALVSAAPMFDAQGEFSGATAMVTDNTRRKRLQATLAATADFVAAPRGLTFAADLVAHAASILELDYVHVARLQPSGDRVETEAAWLDGKAIDNWGYDLHDTPCSEVLGNTHRLIESGVQVKYPLDADLKQVGAEAYVGEPVVDDRGAVLGLIVGISRKPLEYGELVQANLRILAARTAAEWRQCAVMQALRRERDTTRNLLQTAEAIIVALDAEGRIMLINRRGCEILGYSEAELIGQDWFATCLPETADVEAVRSVFRKALAADLAGSEYYENPVRTRTGEERLIAWHNSSIRDDHGDIIGGMSAGMDITERHQAELRLQASEERFHKLFDGADALSIQGYLIDGTVVYWNRASENLYGYSAAEAIGGSLYDLIIPAPMRATVSEAVQQMFETGQPSPAGRLVLQHKNGGALPVYSSHTMVQSPGQPTVMFCMDINLAELDRAETALKVALTKYKTLFDCFPMGITITDPDGQVLETNAAAAALLGVTGDEQARRGIASPEWRVVNGDGLPMQPADYASVRALTEKRRIENMEMGVLRPDGTTVWLSVTADQLPVEGYGVVVAYSDISARRAAEEQVRQMAYFDALTSLPNRRLFLDRLEQTRIASSRSRMWGALVMIDLDDLKSLNDSYGHDAGDQFLIEVARRLREQVRQADSVARMGGDEFVLVLADLGVNETEAGMQAERVVEKVRLALSESYLLPDMVDPYPGSASFGFSLFQGQDVTVQTLLKQADIALYQAKDAGRNRAFMFHPEA